MTAPDHTPRHGLSESGTPGTQRTGEAWSWIVYYPTWKDFRMGTNGCDADGHPLDGRGVTVTVHPLPPERYEHDA